MKRVKLEVAYDGTNYCGWQIQSNGITIEGVLNRCLSELLGEQILVIGTSRTDSGVHACGNVAVFDTVTRIPPEKISYALNQRLPEDIRIQDSSEVPVDFHPRYSKSSKTYIYRILNKKFDIPIYRHYTHFLHTPLEVDAMREAASYLVGTHDYLSFCSAGAQVKDTIRTVNSLVVQKNDDIIELIINGNGFLYNMVRIIAGTLIEAGKGVYSPEYVKTILEACDRSKAGPTAPAKGLTLFKIYYDDDPFRV